jgi:hypothetical protein
MPQFTCIQTGMIRFNVVIDLFMLPDRPVATVMSYLFESLNKAIFSVNRHVEVLLVTMDVANKGP